MVLHGKQAEKKFVEAIKISPEYALAYYNLGVVYTELNQPKAAESAFLKSIEKDPSGWQAYYALGVNLFDRAGKLENDLCLLCAQAFYKEKNGYPFDFEIKACEKEESIREDCKETLTVGRNDLLRYYENIRMLCDHVIFRITLDVPFLERDYSILAKVHNLKGHAIVQRYRIEPNYPIFDSKSDWNSAIDLCRKAVGYSWIDIIISEIKGEDISDKKKVLSECLIDVAYLYRLKYNILALRLGEEYASQKDLYSAKRALRALYDAISVNPADANLHFELGKVWFSLKRFKDSAREYEYAAGIAPEKPKFWANMALAHASSGDSVDIDKVQRACSRVPTFGKEASPEALEVAAEAYEKVGEGDRAKMLRRAAFAVWLNRYSEKGSSFITHLESLMDLAEHYCHESGDDRPWATLEGDDKEWRYSQMILCLTRMRRECWHEKGEARLKGIDRTNELHKDRIRKSIRGLDEALNKIVSANSLEAATQLILHQDIFAQACLEFELNGKKNPEKTEEKFCIIVCKICLNMKGSYNAYALEFSHLLVDVGGWYLEDKRIRDYRKAEKCFTNAIELLDAEHSDEIQRIRLRTLLAISLHKDSENGREKDKPTYCALELMRKAQSFTPLERENAKEMGEVYSKFQDYVYAIENLGMALSRNTADPDSSDADILMRLGVAKMQQALGYTKRSEREQRLKEAKEDFNKAFDIYDRHNLTKRGEMRYYLGRVCIELCEYDEAIPHFAVVYNVRPEGDPRWLIAGLYLGYAYLYNKNYSKSEEVFRDIIKEGSSRAGLSDSCVYKSECLPIALKLWYDQKTIYHNMQEEIEEGLMDTKLIGEILTLAYIGLAFSYSGRGVRQSQKTALNMLKCAEFHIGMLCNPDSRTRCEAYYQACKGRVLYRLKRDYDECHIAESIECLEKAIFLMPTARAYRYLAQAYWLKADEQLDEEDKSRWISRAEVCCEYVGKLDIKGEFDEERIALEKKLSQAKEKPKA